MNEVEAKKPVMMAYGWHGDRLEFLQPVEEFAIQHLSQRAIGSIAVFIEGHEDRDSDIQRFDDIEPRPFREEQLEMVGRLNEAYPKSVRVLYEKVPKKEKERNIQEMGLSEIEMMRSVAYFNEGNLDGSTQLFSSSVKRAATVHAGREKRIVERLGKTIDNRNVCALVGFVGTAHSTGISSQLQKNGHTIQTVFPQKRRGETLLFPPFITAIRRMKDIERPISLVEWYQMTIAHGVFVGILNELEQTDPETQHRAAKVSYDLVRRLTSMDQIRDFEREIKENGTSDIVRKAIT